MPPKRSIRRSRTIPIIANLSHQVIIEQTPEGLRIQLVDQDGRPMFQQGTAEPMPYTKKLLAAVGGIIDRLPNRVSISGHTGGNDGAAGGSDWELSSARANAGPRPAAGAAACRRTASTKWPARPVPSRCCRKIPTPRPTGGCASCCCAKRRPRPPGHQPVN